MKRLAMLFINCVLVFTMAFPSGASIRADELPGENESIESWQFSSRDTKLPGESSPDGDGTPTLLQALYEGTYPAQLVGSTGNIQSTRHGPQRNDPAEGIPTHAYSPFDERNNREHPCPPGGCDFMEGQVIVKLAPDVRVQESGPMGVTTNEAQLDQALDAQGVLRLEPVFPDARAPRLGEMLITPGGKSLPKPDLSLWQRAYLATTADVISVAEELARTPGVLYAEPDYLRRPTSPLPLSQSWERGRGAGGDGVRANTPSLSTDPLYSQQWHLGATNIPQAWTYLESLGLSPGGSRDIIVAVIDTGVDYTHPDLAANMWVNPPEFSGTPGVDDDGNGYVDDIYGVDTVYPDGDPIDDHGHGTHVAGIIAAQADNSIGGVGVAYNVQIMALKAAQYSGVLTSSDIAEAIYYAVQNGADVINMSFGGYARSQVEEDALAVAFGQAVLVAAAGNDGKVNLPCPFGRDMYPAAYNWVLGVMASTSSGGRAGFSNFDCTAHDTHEYELLAPGVDVWSTLPVEQYAAWDGTSMATPIVSGIAALLRTKWADKDVYSSRFIMGQIAANTSGGVANAHAALTVAPEPELSYLEHWLFDTAAQHPDNDDDGVVDAGETIDLAIVIRNHWGKADPVTVTLEAQASGAVFPDPYVTMITDTVSYGAIGSFNWDDNGLIYDGEGVITGVHHPFRFSVAADTPNDHVIPFLLTMTARNGLDPLDTTEYTFQSRFNLIVQKGRELPRIISEDMILTKEYFWIVPGQTLIQAGVTVTVTEGTQIQWGSPDPDDPYSSGSNAYIQVGGKLECFGTLDEPIEFFTSEILGGYVSIQTGDTTNLRYVKIRNPKIGTGTYNQADITDHSYFDGERSGSISSYYLQNSIVHKIPQMEHDIQSHHVWTSLLDSLNRNNGGLYIGYYGTESIKNSVFLQDNQNNQATNLNLKNGVDENNYVRFYFPDAYDGKTYVAAFGANLTFSMGEIIANYFGGHLVSINDDTENAYLTDYVNTELIYSAISAEYGDPCMDWTCPGDYQEARIGLSDHASEGAFSWISGEAFTYSNWRTGQPDDGGSGEDYVELFSDGTWNDIHDQTNNFIILELPGNISQQNLDDAIDDLVVEIAAASTVHVDNAFLSKYWDPNIYHWMRVDPYYQRGRNWYMGIAHNYWGTTSTTLIETSINDFNDDFNKAHIVYQPFYTTPVTTTFPFVIDVLLSTSNQQNMSALHGPTPIVGSEPVTYTVTYNRDMDTSVQPSVSFGPDVPNTDYTVHPVDGGWQDARTWVGTFNITPITGDGYQLMRIAGGRAADDHWLVAGDDVARFRFEIITSGTEAMNLQATGGEGYVDLSWTQDDFDLLAGYNLYRSTSQDGTYTRLNQGLIPADQKTYRDTDVTPGQPYYYKFTIVKTDMSESDFSNVATATPIDTIPPVISHTPVTSASPLMPLTIYSDVTDNVGVQSVTFYYRHIGDTTYSSKAMVHTTGNRYSATLEGSLITSPGIEYYIEANDGISTVRSGRPEYPHQVTVVDKPVVTSVTPNHGPSSGGTTVTIAGSNFKAEVSVTFGGAVASNISVLSSSQITCTTPAHFPETVDVIVTNQDAQSGTLLRGFTFESDIAFLSLPDTGGGQHNNVQIPINLANVDGLAAASLTVTFDETVLDAQGATTGSLTPGWSMAANTNTPGQVRISMASSGGTVSGSGTLALLEFDVVGSPGATSTLHPTSVLLNDGAISVDTDDGSFTVDLVYDVSGRISFWNGGNISGTLMTLQGDRVYSAQSDTDGLYTVVGAPSDDYNLTPSKSNEVNGITAYDASLTLQHDAGLITLGSLAFTAGDVNKNGNITSMDAFYILQKAVDLINLPFTGAGVVWDYNPTSRSYSNLASDQTNQDFTGILLGDPSGSWTPGSGVTAFNSVIFGIESVTATLSLPDANVLPGGQVIVPLELTLTEGNLYGADISITYDPSIVSVVQIDKGNLASDWITAFNLNTPGVIRAAMAGAIPITSSGDLLSITFQAVGSSGLETDTTITRASLNEGGIPTDPQNGSIYIANLVQANFDASPTSGIAPMEVNFTNSSTGDFNTSLWDFGDGITSTLTNPIHTYEDAGTYTVMLTVSGIGGTDSETKASYITVNLLFISGTIAYWQGSAPVSGTLLNLDDLSYYSDATDDLGAYTISGVHSGTYTLTPSKSDDVEGISSYDASLVLQHSAGLITLSGYPAIAADVNKSGAITSTDASYILQKAVDLITLPFPDAGLVWQFDPSSRNYTNLQVDQANQDFTAVLIGDVSGNWSLTQSPQNLADLAVLRVESSLVAQDGTVTATIWLDPAGAQVYSLDLALTYDDTRVTPQYVSLGPGADGWLLASNLNQTGVVLVTLAGAQPITEAGVISTLRFQLSDLGAQTPLDLIRGDINEGTVLSSLVSGSLGGWCIYLPLVTR